MENRKCVMIDEKLHRRLKSYCGAEGLLISSYVENCIKQFLIGDELVLDGEYNSLNKRFSEILKKASSDIKILEGEEYKKLLQDQEKFWRKKDIEDGE
jgi:hypothetical protein